MMKNKRVTNLMSRHKKRYGDKLTDKQYEKLVRATLTGRVWGIRKALGITRG